MLLASLRQAEARLESAGADEGRARQLHREGVVSPQEYQRLKTTRDGAGAERDLLAIRLKHATIRAPISGAVTSREIDVGDYARVGSPLFTVVADQRLRLRGEVSERFVPDLAVGLELRGEVDAYPGLTVRGHLSRLNAALDPKNRSLTVEAEVENSGGRLRPGFFVRGSILTQRGVDTVSVPSNAIVTLAGISHLFVFSGGEAHERQIQVGQRFEDEVEILSGLKPGEPVIVSGLTRLHDGARVRPTTETAEAG
jgi:RND family efflux transporter MFP subunit